RASKQESVRDHWPTVVSVALTMGRPRPSIVSRWSIQVPAVASCRRLVSVVVGVGVGGDAAVGEVDLGKAVEMAGIGVGERGRVVVGVGGGGHGAGAGVVGGVFALAEGVGD